MDQVWRRCSSCKNPLPFGGSHWVCNVSTCNRPRLFLTFCSVSCWDAHLATVRHRNTWAEERKSPTAERWAKVQAGEENWPPRAAKVKAPEAKAELKPSGAPKVVLRKKAES